MKPQSKNNVKLGLFVTLGIGLFIVAIYMIGVRQHLFSPTFRLSGVFSDIAGLQIGSNVRYSGINVGVIESIEQISDSTVRVDMQVEESTRKFIKQNATAIITSDGLVGDKIISISPGSPGKPQVVDNSFIATVQQVSFDDVLVDLKATSENAVIITDELAFIMENIGDGNGLIGKLLFDSSFAELMEGTVENLKQGAGGFKQNMDAASQSILLRGYLKKKERAKAREAEKALEEKSRKAKRNVIGRN